MRLITEDWRLKLLAVGLAVLMLGAVAFSQNPTTAKTLTVSVTYVIPDTLILINAPSKTTVRVSGLADTVAQVTPDHLSATIDVSKASPGPSVPANLTVVSTISDVKLQYQAPYLLNIDRKTTVSVPVTVRTPRRAAGWDVTKAEARCPTAPCVVNFTGPSSWETNLTAYADFPSPVENTTNDVFAQPVILVQNGLPLDLTRSTSPPAGLDISTVAIHVEARTGSSSRQVVLIDAPPSHGPPPGYRITNITIDPSPVVILTGPADTLSKINTITLPAVDLSGHISDFTFQITIPFPNQVEGSFQVARVTYSISPNPSATPT